MNRTRYGREALDAFLDWLAPADCGGRPPEALRGMEARNGHANREAVTAFLAELRATDARRVHLEGGGTTPLCRARFRPPGEDSQLAAQEGVFGFGRCITGLHGVRIRMSAPGVLEAVDAWGDSIRWGSFADARFDETKWSPDRWDLPAPVPPLRVDPAAVGQAADAALALLWRTDPVDRAAADAAIRAHYARRPFVASEPEVRWFDGPDAAQDAFRAARPVSGRPGRELRDRALNGVDREMAVRLEGCDDALKRALEAALETGGARVGRALFDRALAGPSGASLDYLGTASDTVRLAWYDLLERSGAEFAGDAASYLALTRAVWLLLPGDRVAFAVDRPARVERDAAGLAVRLLFRDGTIVPLDGRERGERT